MGDRCHVIMYCREEDIGLFENLGFVQQAEEGIPWLVIEEGYFYDGMEGIPKHVPFYGSHTEGYEYPGEVFVCDGERMIWCDTGVNDDIPVVPVSSDGTVAPEQLANAKLYWELLNKVKQILEK